MAGSTLTVPIKFRSKLEWEAEVVIEFGNSGRRRVLQITADILKKFCKGKLIEEIHKSKVEKGSHMFTIYCKIYDNLAYEYLYFIIIYYIHIFSCF